MSEDVVVTLVNQDSEDLVDFPEVRHVKIGGEDEEGESADEGDIEIEHFVGDDTQSQGGENGGEDPNQVSNITFDVRKRTLIMLWQRTILEEYYRAGMTSASMQLHSLHQEAAEKTGLDNSVVKNWIRNRRRPAAIKSAERMVEKISQGELVAPYIPPAPTSLGSSFHHPSPPTPIITFTHSHPLTAGHTPSQTSALLSQQGSGLEAKRLCLDPTNHPFTSPSLGFTPSPHPSPSLLTTASSSLLVKIRVSGSGEADFFEVEVTSPTYESLLKGCAEELEVEPSHIAKIRKLPNILVRRDRDVQRLRDGQEMEVVLKEEEVNVGAFCATSTGLSMLNLTPLVTDPLVRSGTMGLHPSSQNLNGLH